MDHIKDISTEKLKSLEFKDDTFLTCLICNRKLKIFTDPNDEFSEDIYACVHCSKEISVYRLMW
jgi:hypothetical protein